LRRCWAGASCAHVPSIHTHTHTRTHTHTHSYIVRGREEAHGRGDPAARRGLQLWDTLVAACPRDAVVPSLLNPPGAAMPTPDRDTHAGEGHSPGATATAAAGPKAAVTVALESAVSLWVTHTRAPVRAAAVAGVDATLARLAPDARLATLADLLARCPYANARGPRAAARLLLLLLYCAEHLGAGVGAWGWWRAIATLVTLLKDAVDRAWPGAPASPLAGPALLATPAVAALFSVPAHVAPLWPLEESEALLSCLGLAYLLLVRERGPPRRAVVRTTP
jgi:hypothetical protein